MNLIEMVIILILLSCCKAEELDLRQQRIVSLWKDVAKQLNRQKILRLNYIGLTQQSLTKILSLELPLLEELHFEYDKGQIDSIFRSQYYYKQFLTPQLLKIIFTSRYFPRLTVLNLRSTNLDDRYFEFLAEVNLTTSLKELNLQLNYIGRKGFELLSRVTFTNLTAINLKNTLLIQPQSIDALIRIICGTNQTVCINSIEHLDLSATNIEQEQLIRLISKMNPSSLRFLQLNSLNLIYKTTYKEGFNYTIFQVITTKFRSLKNLSLQKSLINDQIALIFKDWSLPNLTYLNLQGNRLTDRGVLGWIRKKNMPNLQSLNLVQTDAGDETIEHLGKQKFQLVNFKIGNSKISAKGGSNLRLLNTERLQTLYFSFDMSCQDFNDLIVQQKFKNLHSLLISSNSLMGDIFTQLNLHSLKNLDFLLIHKIHLQQNQQVIGYFKNINKRFESASNVRFILLEQTGIDSNFLWVFLRSVQFLFPKLEQLIIIQPSFNSVDPTFFRSAQLPQNMLLQINSMQLINRKNQYQVLRLNQLTLLFKNSQSQPTTIKDIQAQITIVVNQYDFSKLELIIFNNRQEVYLFFRLLEYARISSLPNLAELAIYFTADVQFIINTLSSFHFPCLKGLTLKLLVGADMQDKGLSQFLNKFITLQSLSLQITYLNQQQSLIKRRQLLDSLYFPTLMEIFMHDQNMEVQQVAQFVRRHNQTLRFLNLGNNFLQKNFLKILVEGGFVLQRLSMDSTSFSVQEFGLLSKAKTQFISMLFLQKSDLTSQHFLQMLKNKNPTLVFPKLQILDLGNNDVRKQGLQALFKTHLYSLITVNLQNNNNPHFINILHTYPTRIQLIQALNVDVYGIKDDLQPLSPSNLKQIDLKTKSFIEQDFKNLARLSFSQLKKAYILFFNLYSCEALIDILSISRNVKQLILFIQNDDKRLNSSCLEKFNHLSHISLLYLWDKYGSTYLPQFAQNLINSTSKLTALGFINTRFHPQFFNKIFTKAWDEIQQMNLKFNQVEDEAIKILLKSSSLQNLIDLDLTSTYITDSSVQALTLSKLPNLKYLDLSQNDLSVKAINSLQKFNKNALFSLALKRCGLYGDSLTIMSGFKSNHLHQLLLGFNNFSEEDIIKFASNIYKKALPSLQYIGLQGVSLSKANYQIVKNIFDSKRIYCSLDPPHNVMKVNAAGY